MKKNRWGDIAKKIRFMHFSEVHLSLTFGKAYFISHLLTFKTKLHPLVSFFHSSWTLFFASFLTWSLWRPFLLVLLFCLECWLLVVCQSRSPSPVHRQVPGFLRPADVPREPSQDLSVWTNWQALPSVAACAHLSLTRCQWGWWPLTCCWLTSFWVRLRRAGVCLSVDPTFVSPEFAFLKSVTSVTHPLLCVPPSHFKWNWLMFKLQSKVVFFGTF